ncbi:hypothetical protein EVAR_84589_1 [Eumeta japonica]|uniref:Uncharacterized protein n=1 Tax=Eumeta variegata TaxID=151549 RepID=A0A4C1ZF38_EUMVA|nr:hypothetical protein EVAR_84589_1 [Eumeta japonica]
MVLTERGRFVFLREFEVYCASPASPDAIDNLRPLKWRSNLIPEKSPVNGQPPFARRRTLPPIRNPGRVTFRITPTSLQSGAVKHLESNPKHHSTRRRPMSLHTSGLLPKNLKRHLVQKQPLPPNRQSRFTTLQRVGGNFPSLPQPRKGR